jgi:lincosamide nucleotidyltransferase A/C/D/E
MMNEDDVIDLLKKAEDIGVNLWIDGGWGVDALVGYQTRPHNDIDIFIQKKDTDIFTKMLNSNAYRETKMEFTTDVHKAFCDSCKRIIDLHIFEFTKDGNLRYENEIYPSKVLDGKGKIGRITVHCLTAEAQILYHQGYEHKEKDIQDVLLICKTFDFPIPEEYEKIRLSIKSHHYMGRLDKKQLANSKAKYTIK